MTRSKNLRKLAAVAAAFCIVLSQGCATLAHRSSYTYKSKTALTSCETRTHVCPWLVGDALLLIPGIVPGVIAFVVDFGTGAWQHDHFQMTEDDPIHLTSDTSLSTNW